MRCLDLPPSIVFKRAFVMPLAFFGPPEPKDLDRCLAELLGSLKALALDGVKFKDAYGLDRVVYAMVVEWTCDSRGREKVEQRGGANKKMPMPNLQDAGS